MASIIDLFEAYGLLTVFAGVLVEQLGAPIPAVPFLLLAGAHSATDGLFALKTMLAATTASAIADTVWYCAGRRYGRSVLGLLCRVSISPGTCVQKSEASFSRRGVLTLLFAKFIPGVSALATPMAGALRMPFSTFVLVNLAGSALWVGSGLAAGLVFHEEVKQMMSVLDALGAKAMIVVAAAVLLYVAWRSLRRYLTHRLLRAAPTLTSSELAVLMDSGAPLTLLDVRSTSVLPQARIPGALHAPLHEGFDHVVADVGGARIVTYCDCPNDASAARAALALSKRGHKVQVLEGGFHEWAAAGLPIEIMANLGFAVA